MSVHRRMLRLLIHCGFGIALASLVLTPLAVQSQSLGATPDPRFGVVEAYYRPDDAVEAGVAWERIVFEWQHVQPDSANDWETKRWVQPLTDARSGGRMVVGLIKNAPMWATGSTVAGAIPNGLDLPLDDPNNLWAAFVKKLVTYYKGKWAIHDWIIYNEPDIRPGDRPDNFYEFAGEVQDYYKMVKVAYKVAHSVDPQAIIHLAGFAYWYDFNLKRPLYFQRLMQLVYNDPEARRYHGFFDVMSIHLYTNTWDAWWIIRQYQNILYSFNYPKPIWIDEMNMRPTSDGDWSIKGSNAGDTDVSLDEQATYLVQATALALASNVDRIGIYRLFDDHYNATTGDQYEAWGLIRSDGTRRPAYFALKTITRYFGEVAHAERFSNYGVTLVTLSQPEGTIYVVWNGTKQPLTVRIKARANSIGTTLISATGDTQALKVSDAFGGVYQFDLPPCSASCVVEGKPQILFQPGAPLTVWRVNAKSLNQINNFDLTAVGTLDAAGTVGTITPGLGLRTPVGTKALTIVPTKAKH